jgi:hypothetical protein
MKASLLLRLLPMALLAGACHTGKLDVVEVTPKGPTAEELLVTRFVAINGRTPSFDEKRHWEAQVEERVYAYLRQHPEMEQTNRYSEFRFWWQVTTGSTPGEVRVLLDEPTEQTIDPARMAALAEHQWGEISPKAKEAWFYSPAWVIYFDDTSVVGIVHKVSSLTPNP